MNSLPRKYLPLVILHRIYMIDINMARPDNSNKYYVECTFILVRGEVDPQYSRELLYF